MCRTFRNQELRDFHHSPYINYSGDQVKEDEMGTACDTYRGGQKCIQGWGGETCKRAHFDDLVVGGKKY